MSSSPFPLSPFYQSGDCLHPDYTSAAVGGIRDNRKRRKGRPETVPMTRLGPRLWDSADRMSCNFGFSNILVRTGVVGVALKN